MCGSDNRKVRGGDSQDIARSSELGVWGREKSKRVNSLPHALSLVPHAEC